MLVRIFSDVLHKASSGWDFQKGSNTGPRETELWWQIILNFVVDTPKMYNQLRQESKVEKTKTKGEKIIILKFFKK